MVKLVGLYELGRTLGCGAFSKVKVATHIETKVLFAVKIIDIRRVVKEKMQSQLKKEIAIMKLLSHRNIVRLHEVLQTRHNIYIVLELITGGELFSKIVTERRFDDDTARYYFRQLITGVEYCHGLGIAHRDLKPENLLLGDKDVLKISDFGLSTLTSAEKVNQMLMCETSCGTPNYVAPEILKRAPYDGMRADIWSCGIVLFVMLCGYLPFEDDMMPVLFRRIQEGKHRKFPYWVTEDARHLISKMLDTDPSKRITLEGICSDPWFTKGIKGDHSKERLENSAKLSETLYKIDNLLVDEANVVAHAEETTLESKVAPAAPLNAFEMASQFLAGSLNPLMAMESVDTSFEKYTKVLAKGSRDEVMSRVVEELKTRSLSPQVKAGSSEHEMKIKCQRVQPARQFLLFVVTVTTTVSGSVCLVSFNRWRGEVLAFNALYREIIDSLEDILYQEEE